MIENKSYTSSKLDSSIPGVLKNKLKKEAVELSHLLVLMLLNHVESCCCGRFLLILLLIMMMT